MATKDELDEYTIEGYEISPFINFTDIDLDEVDSFETVEVYYDKLKDFASSLDIALDDFLVPFSNKNNHVLRLYRLEEPYNIKVEDILSVLNSALKNDNTYISLSNWVDFMEAEFEESNIFFPSPKEEAGRDTPRPTKAGSGSKSSRSPQTRKTPQASAQKRAKGF